MSDGSSAPPRKASARRERVKLATWASRASLAALPLYLLGSDLAHRAGLLARYDALHLLGYVASAATSLVYWSALLAAATSARDRRVRAFFSGVFLLAASLVLGVQGAFHALYNFYCGLDAMVFVRSFPRSLTGDLPLTRPAVLVRLLLGVALAVGFLLAGRRFVRTRPRRSRLAARVAPVLVVAVCIVPASYHRPQASLPDQIYFHGLGADIANAIGLVKIAPLLRPIRRDIAPLPKLTRAPGAPRNVVLLLEESQRYDVTCVRYDPNCTLANRFTNRLFPKRIPYLQMRSNDSATAISLVTLLSGLSPSAPPQALKAAPLLWDYAKAAGYETVYWTSHHPVFESARLWWQDAAIDQRISGTELDADADFDWGGDDFALSEHAVRHWDDLKEPFFAVIHYANPHYPYKVDPAFAPFQPSGHAPPESNPPGVYENYYKNAIYRSDAAVAKLVEKIQSSDKAPRTVIVFTSDHGEDIGASWGHTWSLGEGQVHVPLWINAPEGTLSKEEDLNLRRASTAFVWHLDLATTLLDLLGVWDDPALDAYKAKMLGHPLTRATRTTEPVPMTNCSWVWGCRLPNWGAMQGSLKLYGTDNDKPYRCFDLRLDPSENRKRDDVVCRGVLDGAQRYFPDLATTTAPFLPFEEQHWP